MKKFIGWSVIVLAYAALFWVFPYFALKDRSALLGLEIIVHSFVIGCIGIAKTITWAFWE